MAARWAGSETKNKDGTLNGAAGGGGDGSEPEQQIKGEAAPDTEAGLPDLQAFLYGENAVRAVQKNGEVWFDHPPLRWTRVTAYAAAASCFLLTGVM